MIPCNIQGAEFAIALQTGDGTIFRTGLAQLQMPSRITRITCKVETLHVGHVIVLKQSSRQSVFASHVICQVAFDRKLFTTNVTGVLFVIGINGMYLFEMYFCLIRRRKLTITFQAHRRPVIQIDQTKTILKAYNDL